MRCLSACLLLVSVLATVCHAEPDAGITPVERAAHLLLAARHFEAIGENESAKAARDQVVVLKLADDEARQAANLANGVWLQLGPQLARSDVPITVHVEVYQLAIGQLKARGIDIDRELHAPAGGVAIGAQNPRVQYFQVDPNHPWLKDIQQWQREGLARQVASPTVVTQSGRPASFHAGGELAVPVLGPGGQMTVEHRPLGTVIDFVPRFTSADTVDLALQCAYHQPRRGPAVVVNAAKVPSLATYQASFRSAVKLGKTLIVRGLVYQDGEPAASTDLRGRRVADKAAREWEFVVLAHVEAGSGTTVR